MKFPNILKKVPSLGPSAPLFKAISTFFQNLAPNIKLATRCPSSTRDLEAAATHPKKLSAPRPGPGPKPGSKTAKLAASLDLTKLTDDELLDLKDRCFGERAKRKRKRIRYGTFRRGSDSSSSAESAEEYVFAWSMRKTPPNGKHEMFPTG